MTRFLTTAQIAADAAAVTIDKIKAPHIEVCWGINCLFGVEGNCLYGVRELKTGVYGTEYWFHHAWGITDKLDAVHLVRTLYADRGLNPMDFPSAHISSFDEAFRQQRIEDMNIAIERSVTRMYYDRSV